jgi:hypothetical protein
VSGEPDRDRAVDDMLRRSRAGQSRATVGARSDTCLDPETLALWVDDGLNAAERATAERHVADCAACQATLAALVRTAPIPERSTPWWQTLKAAWLAPIAAAAAALALWIVVPGAPPPRSAEQPAPASVEPAPPPARQEAQNAPANTPAPPVAARGEEKRLVEKPVAAPEQTQQSQAPTQQPAEAPPASSAAAAPPAATPVPLSRPSVASRAFAPAAADSTAKSTALANALAPEIISPDSMSRWRITSRRIVEHSTDGGATWLEQPTGVALPAALTFSALIAGSAPSASICWIVGQDGVVLLSTDGRTWRRVAFPATIALVSVRAADERTATITDINGRTYTTSDGGVRWAQSQ